MKRIIVANTPQEAYDGVWAAVNEMPNRARPAPAAPLPGIAATGGLLAYLHLERNTTCAKIPITCSALAGEFQSKVSTDLAMEGYYSEDSDQRGLPWLLETLGTAEETMVPVKRVKYLIFEQPVTWKSGWCVQKVENAWIFSGSEIWDGRAECTFLCELKEDGTCGKLIYNLFGYEGFKSARDEAQAYVNERLEALHDIIRRGEVQWSY